jgi:hypothetical protein
MSNASGFLIVSKKIFKYDVIDCGGDYYFWREIYLEKWDRFTAAHRSIAPLDKNRLYSNNNK